MVVIRGRARRKQREEAMTRYTKQICYSMSWLFRTLEEKAMMIASFASKPKKNGVT